MTKMIEFFYNTYYNDNLSESADVSVLQLHTLFAQSIQTGTAFDCSATKNRLHGDTIDDAVTAECYEKIVLAIPEFARDILQSYIQSPLLGFCDTCRSKQSMGSLQTRCQNYNKGQGGRKRIRIPGAGSL